MVNDTSTDRKAERRIYILPPDLLEEVRAYQRKHGISSETEAARRLLHRGLRASESAADVLRRLVEQRSRVRTLRDLAVLVLADHPEIAQIDFGPDRLVFRTRDGIVSSFPPEPDHDA